MQYNKIWMFLQLMYKLGWLGEFRMKVAIVHDYLNQKGGAERVLGVLHEMFPDAPIYTLILDQKQLWPNLYDALIIPSFVQKWGFLRRNFKLFFWLYPFIIRTLKLKEYDLVISSSSAYAKGIKLPKRGNRPYHISYCYTPMRFAWDFKNYIKYEKGPLWLKSVAGFLVPMLKIWDRRTSRSVDQFISISNVVEERIRIFYGRSSIVLHPPVEDVTNSHSQVELLKSPCDEKYFLVVSRFVSYKRLDLAIEACKEIGTRLFLIGQGPDIERLKAIKGSNITFLGWQSDNEVKRYMFHCQALIFPGVEDFGITPVEANLLGRPVVAFAAGGALDTIREGVNGLFFREQTVVSLVVTLREALTHNWDTVTVRNAGLSFTKEVFIERLRSIVEVAVSK